MRGLTPCLVLALLVAGCGGGPRVVETRTVAPFERIVVSSGLEVGVVPGRAGEVRVRAGEDVLDRVVTESSGGVLRLGLRDRGIVIGPDPLGDARVLVTAATLRGLEIDGSGDVTVSGLDEESFELAVRGAGDVEASGSADRVSATIRGAGDADLSGLAARTARVLVQGAGDAELNVSDELDVTVQGAADVSYVGDPDVRSDVQGAGDIRRVRP